MDFRKFPEFRFFDPTRRAILLRHTATLKLGMFIEQVAPLSIPLLILEVLTVLTGQELSANNRVLFVLQVLNTSLSSAD